MLSSRDRWLLCIAAYAAVVFSNTAQLDAAATLSLTGTVRDFKGSLEPGGHPDFQQNKFQDDIGIVLDTLGSDGKPVYRSATTTPTTNGAANFNKWYNNDPLNLSKPLTIVLTQAANGNYVFEKNLSSPEGGFFPINGELFNVGTPGNNFHFTFELHTTFAFNSLGQRFDFIGDDDLWVFVNGKLALDLGGIHSQKPGSILFDQAFATAFGLSLNGIYSLDLFFAERQTSQSNFRIETSLQLRNPEPPSNAIPLPASVVIWSVMGLGAAVSRRRWFAAGPRRI